MKKQWLTDRIKEQKDLKIKIKHQDLDVLKKHNE